jgi:ectoine hydroxylase-related dioxygenase (phytanoyl-CoA dioxygenase family)
MSAASATRLNVEPGRFSSDGYCVFPQMLAPNEVSQARTALDALMAGSSVRPEHLTEPHVKDAFWLELCRHPKIISAVKAVLGENLALIMTHLIVKPARDGKRIAWHQDRPTWASVKGTDIVTVWLAIDDADSGNGCMKVIPSSQQGFPEMEIVRYKGNDVFDLKVVVSPELEQNALPVELAAGDISIHDSYIIHGSEPNISARRRAGFTMRYANALTTQVDVDSHWVPVYLVSGQAGAGISKFIDLRNGAKS